MHLHSVHCLLTCLPRLWAGGCGPHRVGLCSLLQALMKGSNFTCPHMNHQSQPRPSILPTRHQQNPFRGVLKLPETIPNRELHLPISHVPSLPVLACLTLPAQPLRIPGPVSLPGSVLSVDHFPVARALCWSVPSRHDHTFVKALPGLLTHLLSSTCLNSILGKLLMAQVSPFGLLISPIRQFVGT